MNYYDYTIVGSSIAVTLGKDDSPELHFEDSIAAWDGLCDVAAGHILTEEAALLRRRELWCPLSHRFSPDFAGVAASHRF